jgi:excisionase family DNA binding protein
MIRQANTSRHIEAPRILLSEREAAESMGLSAKTLSRHRAAGRIRYVKCGSLIRYAPDAIRDFVEANTVTN